MEIGKILYQQSGDCWLRKNKFTGGAKKCMHILRDVIYVYILLLEVELNYGSNV